MEEAPKKKTPAEIISIVVLIAVLCAIPLAILFDIIALRYVILQFIACLIIPVFAFVILCVAMVASIIFIFGVFLIEQYGFWPLSVSFNLFKEMLGSITISQQEIDLFKIFRIVLIVICVLIFIASIVSKALASAQEENEMLPPNKAIKGRTNAAMVLSILGILVSAAALVLTSQI